MKTQRILFSILLGSLLLAPACRREESSDTGEELTARAEGNFPETRTSYDSDFSIGNFAWESTDQIAVCMSNGQYNLVAIRPDSSDPGLGRFLCSSTSTTTRAYYAVYPASARMAAHYGADYLAVEYPASYDIRGDLLSERAVAPMVANNASTTTELDFYHVGALIRLTLPVVKQNTKTVKVTFDQGVTGTFTVSNPGTNHPTVAPASASGRNAVNFQVADTGLSSDTQIILSIPVPCGTTGTTYDGLQVDMLDAGNTVLAHEEYDRPISLLRHHGEKIVIRDISFTYTKAGDIGNIARTDADVLHDYAQVETITVNELENGSATGNHGPWRAWFSSTAPTGTTVSSSWSETPLPDGNGNDWLSLSAYEGDGNANDVTIRLKQTTAAVRDLMTDAGRMRSELQSGPGVTDLDLSTYDFINKTTGNTCETANCYVIQTHGSYLIPCVYGNAISNGMPNAGSYTFSGTTAAETIAKLVNADGNAIGNARITQETATNLVRSSNLVARVVWQDVLEGYEILTDDDLEYVSSNGTAANSSYIRVNFRKERIMPGNIVIALYDQDNSKILWSWHLWVTSESLAEVKTKTVIGTNASPSEIYLYFLNVNIGYTPPVTYATGTSTARSQYVIITSTTDGKVLDSFQVSQAAHTQEGVTGYRYSSTFYQWGRKDPFLPSGGERYVNKAVTFPADFPAKPEGNSLTCIPKTHDETATLDIDATVLGEMIRMPYGYLASSDYLTLPYNLWNSKADGMKDAAVTKTVYDPSPRGFCVPRRYAFNGVSPAGPDSGSTSSSYSFWVVQHGERQSGRYFSTNRSNERSSMTLFMPAEGCRHYANGSIGAAVSTSGYSIMAANTYTNRPTYIWYNEEETVRTRSSDHTTFGFPVRPARH